MPRYKYELRRSKRKTVSVEISREARIIVRAPLKMKTADIERFLLSKSVWIDSNLEKMKKISAIASEKFTDRELEALKKRAKEVITPKVERFASVMGVEYNRITVKAQKTRFGSCSSKKNLNFNAVTVLMPEQIIDYVVVHELAHLKEMNHSARFWHEVEKVIPDYKVRREYLKQQGKALIAKL